MRTKDERKALRTLPMSHKPTHVQGTKPLTTAAAAVLKNKNVTALRTGYAWVVIPYTNRELVMRGADNSARAHVQLLRRG